MIQRINITSKIDLDDLKLEKGNEIELYYQDAIDVDNFMKIANIDGRIVIFTNTNKVSIEEWKGYREYKKRYKEIEEEQDVLKDKAAREYKKYFQN